MREGSLEWGLGGDPIDRGIVNKGNNVNASVVGSVLIALRETEPSGLDKLGKLL